MRSRCGIFLTDGCSMFCSVQGLKQPRSRRLTMSASSLQQACKYAIIGGGLGGLTAARVMQGHGLKVTVFERDAAREARRQGGSLDLHPESGLWALSQAGLDAKFRALARPEGQDMRIFDKHGQVLWEEVSGPEQPPIMERPEIDRPLLRALPMDSLSEDTVQWGSALTAVEQPVSKDAGYTLRFADGSAATAEVVIGADGARSRVRPLVTEAQPSYCGVSYLELGIPDADRMHPEASALVGQGSMFALSDDKGIMAQRNGDGRIRIYIGLRTPANDFVSLGIDLGAGTDARRAAIVKQFAGWAPQITGLIEACDGICLPWPLYALPAGLRWPSHPHVTLLGDAAHLMAPSGEGANLAMQDGAELALELAKAGEPAALPPSLASSIGAFESVQV